MKKNFQSVFFTHAAHYIDHQLVMIVGYIHLFKQRSYFKLAWSYFVVTGAHRNTELPRFDFKFTHKIINARWNGTKIMVFQLLAACRSMTKDSTACHH